MRLRPRLAPKFSPWFRYRRGFRVRGCASSALVTGQAEAEDAAHAAAEKLATSMTSSPSLVLFFAKGYGPRARSMGSIFQERFKDATVLGCNSEGGVIAEGQEQQTQTFGLAALALNGGNRTWQEDLGGALQLAVEDVAPWNWMEGAKPQGEELVSARVFRINWTVLMAVLKICLMLCLGVHLHFRKLLTGDRRKCLSALSQEICLPCLLFAHALPQGSLLLIKEGWPLLLWPFAYTILSATLLLCLAPLAIPRNQWGIAGACAAFPTVYGIPIAVISAAGTGVEAGGWRCGWR
eukprot:s4755_g3.t1